ncbi:hypothetical protein BgiMline_026729, partial [Biomphalaria glabrata]
FYNCLSSFEFFDCILYLHPTDSSKLDYTTFNVGKSQSLIATRIFECHHEENTYCGFSVCDSYLHRVVCERKDVSNCETEVSICGADFFVIIKSSTYIVFKDQSLSICFESKSCTSYAVTPSIPISESTTMTYRASDCESSKTYFVLFIIFVTISLIMIVSILVYCIYTKRKSAIDTKGRMIKEGGKSVSNISYTTTGSLIWMSEGHPDDSLKISNTPTFTQYEHTSTDLNEEGQGPNATNNSEKNDIYSLAQTGNNNLKTCIYGKEEQHNYSLTENNIINTLTTIDADFQLSHTKEYARLGEQIRTGHGEYDLLQPNSECDANTNKDQPLVSAIATSVSELATGQDIQNN